MDFKKATDDLFSRVTHDDLAEEMGISVAAIRQARLSADAAAHRAPPPGWEKAVLKLAERQTRHFERLCRKLRPGT